jgi:maleate isomerase
MPGYCPTAQRNLVGHITPSGNTVLEPLMASMADSASTPTSHHATRIKVEAITLSEQHAAQFDTDRMLEAATLLADAHVDAILWSGTSGGWTGLEQERAMCARIEAETGIPASTSTLALVEALHTFGLTEFGLAVPYTTDVAARIVEVYGRNGLRAVGMATLGVSKNDDYAHVSEDAVRRLVCAADEPRARCVVVSCTGVAAAHLVGELEATLGKPVLDSVAVLLWKALRMLDAPVDLRGWGALLAGEIPRPSADERVGSRPS